jgi:hypothetical protein
MARPTFASVALISSPPTSAIKFEAPVAYSAPGFLSFYGSFFNSAVACGSAFLATASLAIASLWVIQVLNDIIALCQTPNQVGSAKSTD